MLPKNTIVIGVEGGVVQGVSLVNWEHSVDKLKPRVEVVDYDDIDYDDIENCEHPEALKVLEGKTENTVKTIY